MMIYVASAEPLPLVAWDEKKPSFNATSLESYSEGVENQFSKPHILCLGAHTGCSCGFTDDVTAPETQDSLGALSQYLSTALEFTDSLELFLCWNGDEEIEPKSRQTLMPQDILSDQFVFDELQFFTVARKAVT